MNPSETRGDGGRGDGTGGRRGSAIGGGSARRFRSARRIRALLLAVFSSLIAMLLCMAPAAVVGRSASPIMSMLGSRVASADESDGSDGTGTDGSDSPNGTDGTGNTADSDDAAAKRTVIISIDSATPVVSSTSGYRIKATVTNNGKTTLPRGTLRLYTNIYYAFVSRSDIQQWAQGEVPIAVPNQLGSTTVSALPAQTGTSVTISVSSKNDLLKSIVTWGPKPLLLEYIADGGSSDNGGSSDDGGDGSNDGTTGGQTPDPNEGAPNAGAPNNDGTNPVTALAHTFLTRSSAGLTTTNTPALNITVAMPLTSDSWTVDQNALTQLVSGNSSNPDDVVGLGDHAKLDSAIDRLIDRHGALQVIADPTYLSALSAGGTANNTNGSASNATQQNNQNSQNGTNNQTNDASQGTTAQTAALPRVSGIMQPANFDITTYAASDMAGRFVKAGVSSNDWSSDTALTEYRSALGDTDAQTESYAWQGSHDWTLEALTEARQQGYSVVIAAHDFDTSDDSTVHTGKIVVPTDAGDVTVLAEQRELSQLAQGSATAKTADAENSAGGRLARFMAQSAFYQMEQPYLQRNLLVCFDVDTTPDDAEALMSAIEQATWLNTTNLRTLLAEEPSLTADAALQIVPEESQLSDAQRETLRSTLSSLAGSLRDIRRFSTSILADATVDDGNSNGGSNDHGGNDDHSSDGGDTGSNDGTQHDSTNGTGGNNTNNNTGSNTNSSNAPTPPPNQSMRQAASQWTSQLFEAHHTFAMHALSGTTATMRTMQSGARTLSDKLLGAVAITPSESINVVTETAKMPVTISNELPFPVHVQVSSLTDSMEIVTSRINEAVVPPGGETQITFDIRVTTSGRTTATLALLDRDGESFGATRSTSIASSLQISDMSGYFIIVFAIALGALGLWRQFHRVKDPDE